MMSSLSSDSPDAKKPCKGILKTSSSFDKHSYHSSHRKSAKFDELNVLQTYHPPDKDYGHMKIDEPKTPYNYEDPSLSSVDQLDAATLAERLKVEQDRDATGDDHGIDEAIADGDDSDSDDQAPESDEQKAHRTEFEKRRKMHYKEFEAVKLARKLIEEEEDDDDDNERDDNVDDDSNNPPVQIEGSSNSTSATHFSDADAKGENPKAMDVATTSASSV